MQRDGRGWRINKVRSTHDSVNVSGADQINQRATWRARVRGSREAMGGEETKVEMKEVEEVEEKAKAGVNVTE